MMKESLDDAYQSILIIRKIFHTPLCLIILQNVFGCLMQIVRYPKPRRNLEWINCFSTTFPIHRICKKIARDKEQRKYQEQPALAYYLPLFKWTFSVWMIDVLSDWILTLWIGAASDIADTVAAAASPELSSMQDSYRKGLSIVFICLSFHH